MMGCTSNAPMVWFLVTIAPDWGGPRFNKSNGTKSRRGCHSSGCRSALCVALLLTRTRGAMLISASPVIVAINAQLLSLKK